MFLLSKVPAIFGDNLDNILSSIDKLTKENAEVLMKNNCVFEAVLQPWDVLWLPPGAAMLEETTKGHLNFGAKIPVIQQTEKCLAAYAGYADLSESSRPGAGAKMKQVAAFLSEQQSKEDKSG